MNIDILSQCQQEAKNFDRSVVYLSMSMVLSMANTVIAAAKLELVKKFESLKPFIFIEFIQ